MPRKNEGKHFDYCPQECLRGAKLCTKCSVALTQLLSALFQACVKQIGSANYGDVKKANAVETQYILVTRVLAKNLTGWEVMEILAGSVSQSDVIFAVCYCSS